MHIIIDTHLHFYHCFDLKKAIEKLRENLIRLDKAAVCIGILTERYECHYFKKMCENPGHFFNVKQRVILSKGALLLTEPGFPDLYLLPGRQIITKENIEILCLLADRNIEDGLPARLVIDLIRQQKGVPVISWAPGKWFFKRGELIKKLVLSNKPGTLLLGDTSLRPYGWPKPGIMKQAIIRGFGVLAGSDPLPFWGDENRMGCYATQILCDFDPEDPVESLRSFLLQPGIKPLLIGKRNHFFSLFYRMLKHAKSKKEARPNHQIKC